jgi:UDP-2,3-diacylglucosamine pyrophosphatase LpxH
MNRDDKPGLTRRDLLVGTAAAAAAALAVPNPAPAAEEKDFSFLLLGDLHYDKPEHHDHEWLKREKPNDVRQVENYSRITREVLPALFAEVKARAKEERAAFVCHIGDLVEGLAGTPELAKRHCEDAVAFVEGTQFGAPFLFCKGNHDVTGPGAVEAFDSVLLPFLARQSGQKLTAQPFSERRGDCLFAYFDSYQTAEKSLEWLEATLAARGDARQVFVVIHPPVVPYGARSNWHLFAKPAEAAKRERLLNLLGEHRAIVLCGHLHKYGTVIRETPKGRFAQVAVVSVVPQPDIKAKDEGDGVKNYGPDLVKLEPTFSPDSEGERRALLAAEKPFIRHWEYADAPGYGVVRVRGGKTTLDLYLGLGRRKWRTVPLSDLLEKSA